jgi:O-methyltransferase
MGDYVRHASLDLVSREIRQYGIPGSVAEVGVYQGGFSQFISLFFPDRTLYLFDTFQGFDSEDLKNDAYTLNQDFSLTSVEMVLEKMNHRDKCVVRAGRFPDSSEGLDDRFCFVSLDADLHKPIYAGLCYFWPRLNAGGYIFIHDYNNAPYPGVRAAVDKFAEEHEIPRIPLPDWGGTLILAKARDPKRV